MIADLPQLRPDLVVVDTMDRFSRNLKDGLDLLERFEGHGIASLPLDWDEPNRPPLGLRLEEGSSGTDRRYRVGPRDDREDRG